jgi:hypothetical protein
MVRTQIQLTEAQASELKRVTVASGISMAEAIRQALDAYLGRQAGQGDARRRELALQACGRFAAEPGLATEHNAAFAEGDAP